MRKIETIYNEILFRVIEKNEFVLTQSELSKKLRISLSIVNSALKKLDSIGAVRIRQRNFQVLDVKKILYLWASIRNLKRDIIFQARIELPVREIERLFPDVFYTAYSAYKFYFNDVPADYSEFYVYADEKELEIIKKRFSNILKKDKKSEINPNLFVLKKDRAMDLYERITLGQMFVDLWNLREWYAKDFLDSMENKIKNKIREAKKT